VRIQTGGAEIGDFKPVCFSCSEKYRAGRVRPMLCRDDGNCRSPPGQYAHAVLIENGLTNTKNERGRFSLSAGQDVVIPLAFYRAQRANEWLFISEAGERYFFSADPTKLIARIYGGPSPGNALVFINTDAGWNAMPSVETVASDVSLYSHEGEIR
jgi:hypothetical protein